MARRATHAESIVENDHEIQLLCELVRFPGKDPLGYFEAHQLCDRWIATRGINPIDLLAKFERMYRLLEWAGEERNKRHHRLTEAIDATLDDLAILCKRKGKAFTDPRKQGDLAYEGVVGGDLTPEEIAMIQASRKRKAAAAARGNDEENPPEANEEPGSLGEDDGIIPETTDLPPVEPKPKARRQKPAAAAKE